QRRPSPRPNFGMTEKAKMDPAEVSTAIVALTTHAPRPQGTEPPPRSGVYAIRLITPHALMPFVEGEGGLVYVGMTTDLEAREFDMHFNSAQTGFSTVR